MPLTDYQADLARLLSKNRTFDSYLAGGAAILIEPNTMSYSRALDYFTTPRPESRRHFLLTGTCYKPLGTPST